MGFHHHFPSGFASLLQVPPCHVPVPNEVLYISIYTTRAVPKRDANQYHWGVCIDYCINIVWLHNPDPSINKSDNIYVGGARLVCGSMQLLHALSATLLAEEERKYCQLSEVPT